MSESVLSNSAWGMGWERVEKKSIEGDMTETVKRIGGAVRYFSGGVRCNSMVIQFLYTGGLLRVTPNGSHQSARELASTGRVRFRIIPQESMLTHKGAIANGIPTPSRCSLHFLVDSFRSQPRFAWAVPRKVIKLPMKFWPSPYGEEVL